jgi:putative MATE family efflux protein
MTAISTADMTNGSIFPKIARFSLPLAATGILQLLFNAADVIVVGKFSGSLSLAAVGATSCLINLLIGLFIGISVGANILVARYLGCRQDEHVRRAVHCAIALSALLGAVVFLIGFFFATPLLRLMQTPDKVLKLSSLYLRIYFYGVPAALVYNFAAAVLRAFGDTKRPLLYLTISGIVNVFLNLLLVIVFHLDVAGVAIATVISQYISLALVMGCLMREKGLCRVELRKVRLYRDEAVRMIQIGLPAGLQSVIFNISNVMIQSSINTFGAVAIAGNTAAANLEGFCYTAMDSVFHAAITFTSQNLGAGKYKRIGGIFWACMAMTLVIGLPMSAACLLFGRPLLGIYVMRTDPVYEQVVSCGLQRILWVTALEPVCGLMDVCCGMVRGLGKSWLPMFISAMGACVLRIIWIYTVFASLGTQPSLWVSYPVSWVITGGAHILCFFIFYRRILSRRPQAIGKEA